MTLINYVDSDYLLKNRFRSYVKALINPLLLAFKPSFRPGPYEAADNIYRMFKIIEHSNLAKFVRNAPLSTQCDAVFFEGVAPYDLELLIPQICNDTNVFLHHGFSSVSEVYRHLEFTKRVTLIAPCGWVKNLWKNEIETLRISSPRKIVALPSPVFPLRKASEHILKNSVLLVIKSSRYYCIDVPQENMRKAVSSWCLKNDFRLIVLEYGRFTLSSLYAALEKSFIMVYCSAQETQSLLQFHAWSQDVPIITYAIEDASWARIRCDGSSSPYASSATTLFTGYSHESILNTLDLALAHPFDCKRYFRQNLSLTTIMAKYYSVLTSDTH